MLAMAGAATSKLYSLLKADNSSPQLSKTCLFEGKITMKPRVDPDRVKPIGG